LGTSEVAVGDVSEAWDEEHVDDGECCECGESTHVCQDCPTFGGDGATPSFGSDFVGNDSEVGNAPNG
jgi:hypothetical protein